MLYNTQIAHVLSQRNLCKTIIHVVVFYKASSTSVLVAEKGSLFEETFTCYSNQVETALNHRRLR